MLQFPNYLAGHVKYQTRTRPVDIKIKPIYLPAPVLDLLRVITARRLIRLVVLDLLLLRHRPVTPAPDLVEHPQARVINIEPVVQAHPVQQHDEADQLQVLELLVENEQREYPDDQRSHAVEHHAGRRGYLLRDADPGEVEERDGENGTCAGGERLKKIIWFIFPRNGLTEKREDQQRVVAHLGEAVGDVFEDAAGVERERRADVDVVERDLQQAEHDETEDAWRRNVRG